MKYIDKIIKFLEKIGGENVQNNNINGQEIIGFSFMINKKLLNVAIFHSQIEDRIVFQIFSTLPNAYEEPDLEFYKIIEKLNTNSMLGGLIFINKEDDFFISYKSNLISDLKNEKQKEVEFFITTSLQMISKNYSELNTI
jgi:hypothetical protein